MATTASNVEVMRLRRAMMSLGGPPQAQRHHARMGLLAQACQTVEEMGPRLTDLQRSGALTEVQATSLEAVAEALAAVRPGWRERLPEPGAGFDYLWSDAFEDPGWDAMRRAARRAFTALRPPEGAVPR